MTTSSSTSTRPSERQFDRGARSAALDRIISSVVHEEPLRAGSLIITIFGDAISQHGNSVWLGSVIEFLQCFGLNPRQIRTAVFRLVKDDWLSATQIGRRSYYAFTESGHRQYEQAARRIYALEPPAWDGNWTLVVPVQLGAGARDALRRELGWLGFGQIANGVLAHPRADHASLQDTLVGLELNHRVAVLRAASDSEPSTRALQQLAHECWNLDALDRRFRAFIRRFEPALDDIAAVPDPDPQQMFELRTLLIHEYRRILLKTTDLPDALLPAHWSGNTAKRLVAEIYLATRVASTAFVMSAFESAVGPLVAADGAFYRRFAPAG